MRQVLQAKSYKLQYINGLILKSENSSDNQLQVISQNYSDIILQKSSNK